MGRHSAPDDPEPGPADGVPGPTATSGSAPRTGRHADTAEHQDDRHTQRIAVVDAALLDSGSDADTGQIARVDQPPAPPWAAPAPAADGDGPIRFPDDDTDEAEAEAATRRAPRAERRAAKAAARDAARQAERDVAAPGAEPVARSESNTRADLRLLRTDGAVRAQAIAALVASFLIYTVVMLVLGRGDEFAQWVWIPIVLCGVLIGGVLDLAHRRADRRQRSSSA